MKIKIFRIRTDETHLHKDEESINRFMDSVTVKKTATEFIEGNESHWSVLVYYEGGIVKQNDSIMSAPSEKISFPVDTELNKEETSILMHLKSWRHNISMKTSMPGYMICHNSELVTIAKIKPRKLEDLARIKGFSSQKIMKYGDDVLALLNSV